MGQTCCPSKSWVIKSRSLSKLDNTFNNNSIFIMVGAPSFSEPNLCKKPPLHSPTKICSSTSANFHLPIPPILLHNFILTIPTNIFFLYTSPMFDFPAFAYYHPNNIYQKFFPTAAISPIQVVSRDEGARTSCEGWHCFDLSILPQNMDSDNRTHNHWFLIAQAQKDGVLQVVVSDKDDTSNRNDKTYNPSSLIPSTYCHYFHTLLIPSQKLTFLWKLVSWLGFHLQLSILM